MTAGDYRTQLQHHEILIAFENIPKICDQ